MFRSLLPRAPLAFVPQQPALVPHLPFAGRHLRSSSSPAAPRRGIFFVSRHPMAASSDSSSAGFSGRDWKDSEAHEVLPKVFLGSMEAAKDKESLKSHGVTHILTVNGKEPAFKDDFQYKVIKFGGDNGPLTPHLNECMEFVENGVEDGGVLIHCTHGTGRSAAMAIAAAMKASGKGTPTGIGGFSEAFRLVKSRRPGTDPPMPFQQELGTWEESHSG